MGGLAEAIAASGTRTRTAGAVTAIRPPVGFGPSTTRRNITAVTITRRAGARIAITGCGRNTTTASSKAIVVDEESNAVEFQRNADATGAFSTITPKIRYLDPDRYVDETFDVDVAEQTHLLAAATPTTPASHMEPLQNESSRPFSSAGITNGQLSALSGDHFVGPNKKTFVDAVNTVIPGREIPGPNNVNTAALEQWQLSPTHRGTGRGGPASCGTKWGPCCRSGTKWGTSPPAGGNGVVGLPRRYAHRQIAQSWTGRRWSYHRPHSPPKKSATAKKNYGARIIFKFAKTTRQFVTAPIRVQQGNGDSRRGPLQA